MVSLLEKYKKWRLTLIRPGPGGGGGGGGIHPPPLYVSRDNVA